MRDYLTTPLGGLDRTRTARAGIDEATHLALRLRTHGAGETLNVLAGSAQQYLDDLDEPYRALYEFVLTLAMQDTERLWVPLPRLAGGEDAWGIDKETRYGRVVTPALNRLGHTGARPHTVTGWFAWGADDEDRLSSLGTIPMYLVAGDNLASQGLGSDHVLGAFLEGSRSAGFDVTGKAHQRMDVSAPEMTNRATTVFRVVYSGRRDTGSKLRGGYVSG